jgi:hypothetical protein
MVGCASKMNYEMRSLRLGNNVINKQLQKKLLVPIEQINTGVHRSGRVPASTGP